MPCTIKKGLARFVICTNKRAPMKNLLFFLCFATLFACSKKTESLPEATQIGAGTFGARVNGNFWVPMGFGVVPTAPLLEANFAANNSIRINARNFGKSPTETEFEIFLFNIPGPGTILLNQNTATFPNQSASYAYYIERRFTPRFQYITTAAFTGRVEISRFDPVNKIISGTFEFTAKETSDSGSPLTVTEGRFDLKIQ